MLSIFQREKIILLIMKTVAIPVLEGHSSVVVYPHCSQDQKVSSAA